MSIGEIVLRVRSTAGSERVGAPEREAFASYLREAYVEAYLDDGELDERLSAVAVARTVTELTAVICDLPSYATMTAEPVPVRRGAALAGWRDDHPALVLGPYLLVSALVAVLPTVLICGAHANARFPFNMIIAVTLIAGIVGAALTLGSMIARADV